MSRPSTFTSKRITSSRRLEVSLVLRAHPLSFGRLACASRQIFRDAGKLDEALAEFQRAAEIDPSSFIAQQELRRTQQMIREAQNPTPQASAGASALRRRLDSAQGPVELAPIANVPITLKLTEDTKVIYETIGKLAGINLLFDPDYTSRACALN